MGNRRGRTGRTGLSRILGLPGVSVGRVGVLGRVVGSGSAGPVIVRRGSH
jgi:hypothetical protein